MKSNLQLLLKTLLLPLLCLWSLSTYPTEVDMNTAKTVAINWFAERAENNVSDIRITNVIEEKENGETIFYVITFSEKGFVLVVATDLIKPVIGYSTTSRYDEGNHSPAFEFYILKRFKKQIYAAIQADIEPPAETIEEWQRLSASIKFFQPKSAKGVDPLLTTTWDQGTYYNTQCPADPAGPDGHAVTGCVATAMAQVLNYWQHPWHGTGSHSYTPESHPEYGVQFADFGAALYNFDDMPDVVTSYNSEVTELMYHCGVAVEMDYGPDGSSASGWACDDVPDALKNYFRFDDFAHEIVRSSNPITWPDMMRDNLNNYWPVIYAAYDNQEDVGHAWVLDGYTDGDFFHCNWGWSGSGDGYYSIDDFSVSGFTFDWAEHAISGVYPEVQYPTGTWTLAGSPYYIDYDQVIHNGSELIIEPGVEIIFNGHYNFTIYGRLNASGTETDTIVFRPDDNSIGWHGLRFINTNDNSQDNSYLMYCKLEWGQAKRDFSHNIYGLYGGDIFCMNSSKLTVENSLVKCGSAYNSGGGIACFDNSVITINNSKINYNVSSAGGGGIYCDQSGINIHDCEFEYNNSQFGYGAALFCNNSNPVSINKTIVGHNSARSGGGFNFSYSTVYMDSLIIHHNEATTGYGGAIYSDGSSTDITDSQIYSNSANDCGGGIFSWNGSNINIYKSIICFNSADSSAGIAVLNSVADINNSTVSGNDASLPDAAGGLYLNNSTASSLNSIFWDNDPIEIDTVNNSTLSATYSDIMGGWAGNGNVNADPLFSDPATGDYSLKWTGFPMPDGNKSPCIDTGDPISPLDPDGSRNDIGAIPYEQISTPLAAGNISGTLTCAGSPYFVDGDLLVQLGDQLIIEPCVYIMFRGDYKLSIEGQILAVGTESDNITFACLDTITSWKGLRFVNLDYNGQDSSKLKNCRISWGDADGNWGAEHGGGLYFYQSSNVHIENCLVSKNNADGDGGGIHCFNSSPLFINNTIMNNTADLGGGIYSNSSITMTNGLICNNSANGGGGCYFHFCFPKLSGVTVRNNIATTGGGLLLNATTIPVFDSLNRCNIYSNHAFAQGLDIYASPTFSETINLFADTLTVLYPNEYFIFPMDRYGFDFLNYVIEQENQDLYVATTGSDGSSGTSPSDPLQTIQMALKKIIADTLNPHNIYIDNGLYSESSTGEILPLNPRSFVSLTGTDLNETIISGEDQNQLIYGYEDNYFTIQNMNLKAGYGLNGGAVYLRTNSSPEIFNVKISESEAIESGGGLYCTDGSTPHLSYVEFINNIAGENGGGMMCNQYVHPVLEHVDFRFNEANVGGGIAARRGCDIRLDSCTIEHNIATTGGGLNFYKSTANTMISNTKVNYNNADNGGGVNTWDSDPVFNNVEILFNTAENYGGGINSGGHSYPVFNNVKISGNTALSYGGGMSLRSYGNAKFYNTLVIDNIATNGAGIDLGGYNSEFINVTVTGNSCTSGNGGAVYNNATNPVFLNSIVWDNFPDEFYVNSGTVTAEYCNVEGSWPGTGNINADPVFHPSTLKPLSSSPCINAGNPDTTGLNIPITDLAGDPRIINDTIDMGAYEYQLTGAVLELDLQVLLEGPYNGFDMNTDLNNLNLVPLEQPYNSAPWNYGGTESVVSLPDANIVDWLLLELRDAPDVASATSATTIAQQAVFIKNDGSIVGMDGSSILFVPHTPVDHLFAVLFHRNHLAIMSAYPLVESGGMYSYDFTSSVDQAYNAGQKDLGSGHFGMFSGDANADGDVNPQDKITWTNHAGKRGYNSADFDLDGQINNIDKNDIWIENNGNSSQIPD